jgi:hypothetical protein
MRVFVFVSIALLLVACSNKDAGVRITNDVKKPVVAAAPKSAGTRTEPIFYNGKTYQLKFAPTGQGQFAMSVLGMNDKQKKDATAVATSSLRYFKCKDGQNGVLTSGPSYVESVWQMTAKCS